MTFNPHIHVLAADGVFRAEGVFVALPAIPVKLLERGFRSEVLKLLVAEHAIGERLSERMLGWRHSGFSVHHRVRVRAGDAQGREAARAVHAARAVLPGEDDLPPGHRNGHGPLAHAQEPEAQLPVDARRAMARNALQARAGSL